MSVSAPGDPLHKPGLPQTHWTTDNVGEALPGVATPLGWTIWESGSDRMCRDLSYALGVFTADERDGPAPNQDPIITIFHGRIAMCMEWLGVLGDRMPGTTGPEAIGSMLGRVPETMTFTPTKRRYPVIAAKLPVAALRSPARVRALAAEIEPWWQAQVAAIPGAGEDEARAALRDGAARFRHAMTVHGIGLFAIITPLIQALTALVEKTGVGDVGRLSGTGGAEMAIVEDIWRASRGQLTEAEVATRHGFHGPREGEISSRVWREDPTPLTRMIAAYAAKPESDDPVARDARLRQELPGLQAELLMKLPAVQRPAARLLLRHAARTIPLRGVGKASFLQALDVARAASRRLGELMAADGRLADPGDVFFLALDELSGTPPADARELVATRRAVHAEYAALRLPASWRGAPETAPASPGDGDDESVITGIPAGAGIVEGTVRVVADPSFAEVEPGEILVAHTTDPSWASIMFVSAALVVDIGGVVSHAAVVARELGIPCVVNTRRGTDVLKDGDRVRVDGTAGTVELLERAPAVTPA
jgi:phosphohistidine swiveling domain-containing protein